MAPCHSDLEPGRVEEGAWPGLNRPWLFPQNYCLNWDHVRPNWPQSVPIPLPVREPATEVHAIARAITQSSCWPEGAS